MKTIRIHLHGVEEAMLKDVQKKIPRFRDLEGMLMNLIREEYQRIRR
jgi:hypothetical protein